MTTSARFERQLPDLLEDLYLGPTPDYRDEVLATATRSRQRPAWAIPGRWLPMADIASRPTFIPRLPIRSIAVALVIIALLVAAAVALVGSRLNRVPAPFGVAGNGLLALTSGGDIMTVDPVTGAVRTIVAGPGIDSSPIFSPNGQRVQFLRLHDTGGKEAYDIVVANADGSNPMVVSDKPMPGEGGDLLWSPDSRFVYNMTPAGLDRYDSDRVEVKHVLAVPTGIDFQPPDGARILFSRETTPDAGLYLMDADGSNVTPLIKAEISIDAGPGIGEWQFSPDGTKVVYGQHLATDPRQYRIHIVNADGSGARQLSLEPGPWYEGQLAWSPDGTRIAFNRLVPRRSHRSRDDPLDRDHLDQGRQGDRRRPRPDQQWIPVRVVTGRHVAPVAAGGQCRQADRDRRGGQHVA